jgi:adenosine deaminase
MLEISRNFKLDLPYNNIDEFRPLVQVLDGEPFNYQNFLSKFASLRKFFQSEEVIRQITREAIADAASDNIHYLELRFTPVALSRMRDFPLEDTIDWVIDTTQQTAADYGVKTRLIASVNRHESVELAEEVAQLAADRIARGIIALDLAGSEADYPGEEFIGVFKEAKQAGLRITIHAGEWGGPEIIQLAIKSLGAERIGHGVRVMEDPSLVSLAKERQITFEVCPTSNYQSGVVDNLDNHPLPAMVDVGLNVTVNTDDPGISQIDLSDEYELCCESLKLTPLDLKTLILNAANSAFLPGDEKSQLAKTLESELSEKIEN